MLMSHRTSHKDVLNLGRRGLSADVRVLWLSDVRIRSTRCSTDSMRCRAAVWAELPCATSLLCKHGGVTSTVLIRSPSISGRLIQLSAARCGQTWMRSGQASWLYRSQILRRRDEGASS